MHSFLNSTEFLLEICTVIHQDRWKGMSELPPRPSVREHVQDDHRQDARGRQCRRGDEERREGIAD